MLKGQTGKLEPRSLEDLADLFSEEVQEDWVRGLGNNYKLIQFHLYKIDGDNGDEGFAMVHFKSEDEGPQRSILLFVCQRGNVNMQLVFPKNGHLVTVNDVMFEDVEDLGAFLATPEDAITALMRTENEEGPNVC